jgi:hypothetical protein
VYVTTEVLRERKVDQRKRRFQTKQKKEGEENSERKINKQDRTKQSEDERKGI